MILAEGESSIPPKISTFSLSISERIEIAFDRGILLELATLNGKKDIGSAKSNLDTSAKKDIAESQNKNNKINGKNTKEKKRVSKASQKLDIVNVDNATKEKKGGWWSQSKT